MNLKLKSLQKNRYWIKRNSKRNTRDTEAAALDNWASEGGSISHKMIPNPTKKMLSDPRHEQPFLNIKVGSTAGLLRRSSEKLD